MQDAEQAKAMVVRAIWGKPGVEAVGLAGSRCEPAYVKVLVSFDCTCEIPDKVVLTDPIRTVNVKVAYSGPLPEIM
jgi:hypothetical protein